MEHLGSAAAGLAAGLVLVTSGCERHQGKNESRHPSTAARAESGFVNPAVVPHRHRHPALKLATAILS